MKQGRLAYFDVLKGIAIYLVVMGHVLTAGIRQIDSALLFKIIGLVHMPLFFFISGYFTGKRNAEGRLVLPAVGKRFMQLIVPMVVVSSLWIYYYPHSGLQSPFKSTWAGLWSDMWKNGYWFTLTLFIINIFYLLTSWLINLFKGRTAAIFGVSALIAAGLLTLNFMIPAPVANAIELPFVAKFYPVFMVGVFSRLYTKQYERVTSSPGWFTAAILLSVVVGYYILYPWEFEWIAEVCRLYGQIFIHLLLVIIAVHLARPWCESVGSDSRWLRLWSYLGRNSLAIYLLHYFFLFPMGIFRAPLRAMSLDFVPTLIVSALTAAAIVAVTLGANYVIERSPLLSRLLIGKKV